jgi:hypothetical protein
MHSRFEAIVRDVRPPASGHVALAVDVGVAVGQFIVAKNVNSRVAVTELNLLADSELSDIAAAELSSKTQESTVSIE